jgi:hypothetical protein
MRWQTLASLILLAGATVRCGDDGPAQGPDPEALEDIAAYVAPAAAFDQAASDALIPEGLDPQAGGAPGYTRYVFHETSAGVVPTLLEGPLGTQVRCQDPSLPCSYQELKQLHESGDPIPLALGLTPTELASLVAELDELAAFADAHRNVDSACRDGYISDRIQTPNMGSHFYNPQLLSDGFDPGAPEILLYARADGTFPDGPLGQCRDGSWLGEPLVLVGTAFLLPPQIVGNDHPAAFTGDLDNWHIHFNLCRGNGQGRDSFVTPDECAASGGNFAETIGWMIHAWVAPGHDNDLGIFSMWNSSIVPVAAADAVYDARKVQGSDFPEGARQSIVTNFAFESTIRLALDQVLYFNNADSVPHTITAGTSDRPELDKFDSGLLYPGRNFELRFTSTGQYTLFCTLHPNMTASIVVDDD